MGINNPYSEMLMRPDASSYPAVEDFSFYKNGHETMTAIMSYTSEIIRIPNGMTIVANGRIIPKTRT
ncbi:MAG: hypothetical protein Tsb009_29500 [Planctomycetaceae bacterium]